MIGLLISCGTSLYVAFHREAYNAPTHAIKPLLVFSFPIYISAILSLIVGWVDQMFIFPYLGVDALGVYSLAVRASIVPNLVSVALVTSLFPKLSEMHLRFGANSLKDAFKASTRYAAMLGFPVSFMVATLAYPIIILFATARFVDAVVPLAVMCMASLPTILGSAIFPTLYTLQRRAHASSVIVVLILLEATLAYVLLAHLNGGLVGVALTRLVATMVQFIFSSYLLHRIVRVEFDMAAIWKSAISSILMVLSLLGLELVRATLDPSSYQFLVLRLRLLPFYAIIGITVYLLSLISLKTLSKRDIDLLRDYLPHKIRWVASVLSRIVPP